MIHGVDYVQTTARQTTGALGTRLGTRLCNTSCTCSSQARVHGYGAAAGELKVITVAPMSGESCIS